MGEAAGNERGWMAAYSTIRTAVIIFLLALSVLYFYAVPFLGYMAVAGAAMNNMNSTGPLILFIGFPGVVLAVFWWVGLRLIGPKKPSA